MFAFLNTIREKAASLWTNVQEKLVRAKAWFMELIGKETEQAEESVATKADETVEEEKAEDKSDEEKSKDVDSEITTLKSLAMNEKNGELAINVIRIAVALGKKEEKDKMDARLIEALYDVYQNPSDLEYRDAAFLVDMGNEIQTVDDVRELIRKAQ